MLEHNRILNKIDKDPTPEPRADSSQGGSSEQQDPVDPETADEELERVAGTYRRIICLSHVDRCGMCGTTKHATKPYWNIGMRLCRYCLQDNLVSDLTLEERYWINVGSRDPVGICNEESASFADKVVGYVWFFREYITARQLTEYTRERADFMDNQGKKNRNMWFFWRPHLEKVLDLPTLSEESREKHKGASLIRAIARRTLALRALNATTADRTKPTRLVQWEKKRDRRAAMFKLERTELLSKTTPLPPLRWKTCVERRLGNFEDRLWQTRPLTTKQRAIEWARRETGDGHEPT